MEALGFTEVEQRNHEDTNEDIKFITHATVGIDEDGTVYEEYHYDYPPKSNEAMLDEVDRVIEVVTPIEAIHFAKYLETLALAVDPLPNEDSYPLLSACLGVDGETLNEVATAVISQYTLWKQSLVTMENQRLTAKVAIREAEAPEYAELIMKSAYEEV